MFRSRRPARSRVPFWTLWGATQLFAVCFSVLAKAQTSADAELAKEARLETILQVALDKNPDLQEAASRARAARERAPAASRLPDPEFKYELWGQPLARPLALDEAQMHMFGLRHCFHFECLMNPTAGIEDLDRLPLHSCPVCLRKLMSVTGMSIVKRWQQLTALCGELGLPDEREWFAARLRALG